MSTSANSFLFGLLYSFWILCFFACSEEIPLTSSSSQEEVEEMQIVGDPILETTENPPVGILSDHSNKSSPSEEDEHDQTAENHSLRAGHHSNVDVSSELEVHENKQNSLLIDESIVSKEADANETIIQEGFVSNGKIMISDGNATPVEMQSLPPHDEGSEFKMLAFRTLQEFEYNVDWEKDGMQFEYSAFAERVPKTIRSQSESKVAIEGFMIPTVVNEDNLVNEFLLLPDQMSCCFGQTPEANGWVVVSAPDGVEVLMDRIIRVTGTFTVEERWDEEFFVGLYHMSCEEITGPAL